MADTIYRSDKPAQSAIKKQGLQNFLSTLFGWRRSAKKNNVNFNTSQKQDPLEFVSVDVDSSQRLAQTTVDRMLSTGKLSSKLEELFQSWLQDTSDSAAEIANRARRVDQLTYAAQNDPFIGRVVKLFADEATQLDVQDRLISIETPDPRMTKAMYDLLNLWGVTQSRVRSTILQLAQYGDSFWANSVSEKGVERVIPLKQLAVTDRLEFNPIEALERQKRMDGFGVMASKQALIQQMLDDLEETGDFADLFNTKLFGFVVQNDLVVPPWNITHFRVDGDGSEFFPFGVSPILGTLAPFKLTASTITLQSIARVLSFPVTLYKVKTSSSADEARQFNTVNRVREEYDNIGVSPAGGNSEVYTVNTKIWMPDGLMDVDVKASQVDIGFTGDIEMYQDRVAVATGVPKGYLVQEWGGFGNSAISLVEQFKPFARSVFSLQSAFLEGLANLFRLHFAITGAFDFRVPFTLSLRYPAEEISDEKNTARRNSLDMASDVLNLIRAAIGAEDDESLPPDIVRDIIAKYTFLNPTDIVKWTRDAKFSKVSPNTEEEGDTDDSLDDLDLEKDLENEDEESSSEGESASGNELDLSNLDFGERRTVNRRFSRLKEARLKELSTRYKEIKDSIYFQVLRENAISGFVRNKQHVYVSSYSSYDSIAPMLETIEKADKKKGVRLSEDVSLKDVIADIKKANSRDEDSNFEISSKNISTN